MGHRCGALAGGRQTVNKAELRAFLAALRLLEPGLHLQVYTDNDYVRRGVGRLKAGGVPRNHTDLWTQVRGVLLHEGWWVEVVKVKSHATEEDVRAERISECVRRGSARADDLAGEAAARVQVPLELVRRVADQDRRASFVLRRLVS